jgi:hypothetical protein
VIWDPSASYYIFENIINKPSYIKDVRPINDTDPTTKVKINLFVSHIENVDEDNGAFQVQLIFRQRWSDPRLSYENTPQFQNLCNNNRPTQLLIPDSMVDKIWSPDLFIPQELEAKRHELFHPNRYAKISPNGNVLFSQRITLNLACPQFANSTLTKKECVMKVESYGHVKDEIELDWNEEDPAHFLKDMFVPKRLKLANVTPGRCDSSATNKIWSCIQAKFTFEF